MSSNRMLVLDFKIPAFFLPVESSVREKNAWVLCGKSLKVKHQNSAKSLRQDMLKQCKICAMNRDLSPEMDLFFNVFKKTLTENCLFVGKFQNNKVNAVQVFNPFDGMSKNRFVTVKAAFDVDVVVPGHGLFSAFGANVLSTETTFQTLLQKANQVLQHHFPDLKSCHFTSVSGFEVTKYNALGDSVQNFCGKNRTLTQNFKNMVVGEETLLKIISHASSSKTIGNLYVFRCVVFIQPQKPLLKGITQPRKTYEKFIFPIDSCVGDIVSCGKTRARVEVFRNQLLSVKDFFNDILKLLSAMSLTTSEFGLLSGSEDFEKFYTLLDMVFPDIRVASTVETIKKDKEIDLFIGMNASFYSEKDLEQFQCCNDMTYVLIPYSYAPFLFEVNLCNLCKKKFYTQEKKLVGIVSTLLVCVFGDGDPNKALCDAGAVVIEGLMEKFSFETCFSVKLRPMFLGQVKRNLLLDKGCLGFLVVFVHKNNLLILTDKDSVFKTGMYFEHRNCINFGKPVMVFSFYLNRA